HRDRRGHTIEFLHDVFGRRSGEARATYSPPSKSLTKRMRTLTRIARVEQDDDNRIVAKVVANGHQERYEYGPLGWITKVVYPDGTARHFERDASGNAVRIVDANGNAIGQRFDSLNRLIARRITQPAAGKPLLESYKYDGLSRLIIGDTKDVSIHRRFDA